MRTRLEGVDEVNASNTFRLEPRGLLALEAVLVLEEPPLEGVEDSLPGTKAASEGIIGWMESLSAMSKGGGFLTGQSKYHPHC